MESSKGYVYVMYNSSYSGLVKIGKTTKDPEERAKELSAATGVATPFVVVYKRLFNNCHIAERLAHSILEEKGHRVNDSREFFSTGIPEAIDVILQIPDEECSNVDFPQENLNDNIEEESLAEIYYKKATNYYNGTNGYFQDIDRAAEYFERSGNLGKVEAFREAGYIWAAFKENYGKALELYHQGVQKGDMRCYAYLGEIYLKNNENRYYNRRNADLAWSRFFEYVDELSTLEDFSWRWDFEEIGYNVKKFIFTSILHGETILPQHEEFLYKHRKKIYNTIKDEIGQLSEEYRNLVDYYEKKILPYVEGLEEKYLLTHGEGMELAKNHFVIAEKYFYGTTNSSGLENYPQNYIKAMTLFAKSAELGYKRAYIYQGVCWLKKNNQENANKAWKNFYNYTFEVISDTTRSISAEEKEEMLESYTLLIKYAIDNNAEELIHQYYIFVSLHLGIIDYFTEKAGEISKRECFQTDISEDVDYSELDTDDFLARINARIELSESENELNKIKQVNSFIKDYALKLQAEHGDRLNTSIYKLEV